MALFTRENAREMAARANEAKQLAAIQAANGDLPKPLLPEDKHQKLTLSRVRRQLERCFEMMAREGDPGKIDRLASAIARLNELDRQLSNRSLPPTLKANAPAAKRAKSSPQPEPEQDF